MQEIYRPEFTTHIERGVPVERLEARMRTPFLGRRVPWEVQVQTHDGWENFSEVTFLGENESLLGVVRTDWRAVEQYRTTHAAIANALKELIAGRYPLSPEYEFVDRERQMEAFANFIGIEGVWGGMQECPWFCDTFPGDEGTIVRKGLTEDERIEAYVAQFKFIDGISSNEIDDLLLGGKGAIRTAKLIQRIQANRAKREKPIYALVTGLLPHLIEEHYFFEGKGSLYRAESAFLIDALELGKH